MNTDIQIFNNPNFGEIRTTLREDGEPLFCLADLCRALDIKNPSDCKTRLNPEGVHLIDSKGVATTEGVIINELGNSMMNFVDEPNMYMCIFQSRKAEAQSFQKWVTKEVLPSIRRTGQYSALIPKTLSQALFFAAEQQQKIEEQEALIISQRAKIEADKPKVLYADALLSADNDLSMSDASRLLAKNGVKNRNGRPMGRNSLFRELREQKILMNDNKPYQPQIECGRFTCTIATKQMGDFVKQIYVPLLTPKGMAWLIKKYTGRTVSEEEVIRQARQMQQ